MTESLRNLSTLAIYMKYSRYIPELNRRETWEELVTRNMQMHIKKFPSLKDEIQQAYAYVFEKKVLPSMRSLQFGGRAIELNPTRLYNCSFVKMDSPDAFGEIMFLLMCGCGVGYSIQKHHVRELPEIIKPKKSRRFLITDSVEGWADSVKVLINSYMGVRKSSPEFDFSDIRPRGTLLKTSGGVAPGPEPLKTCLHRIQTLLDRKKDGEKLTTLEVHDINCFLADAVLSGGIRRSAMIALFSFDDEQMRTCKFQNWAEENPQRARANNSAVILRHEITEDEFKVFWNVIKNSGTGEPGIFFTNDSEIGCNPCVTGDTLIATPNGNIPIKDLARENKPVIVYSWNPKTKLPELQWMRNIRLTRKNVKLIEVTFDSGLKVKCTYDHNFYSFRGNKIQAQNLKIGQRVRAFSCSKHPDGHIRLHGWVNNKTQHIWEHRALWELYNGKIPFDNVVNHINNIPDDNRIENLCLMTTYQHNSHHYPERLKNGFYHSGKKTEKILNHKIMDIKYLDNLEDVYNGTVDNCHTYIIADSTYCGEDPRGITSGIVSANCGEISLKSFQFCNLVTVNVTDLESQREFESRAKAAAFIATLQAAYTDFHYLRETWKETTEKDALIGVSLSGIASNKIFPLDIKKAAEVVKQENERVSKILGIKKASRATTVKPEGTSSLVLGCSSGIHAWHSPYYIRRIRINKIEPLYNYLLKNNPEILEDDYFNPTMQAVISLPIEAPFGAVFRTEKALDLLTRVKIIYKKWIQGGHRKGHNNNNVSCTVSIKENEWDEVGKWMWDNKDCYTSITVLPYDNKLYIQPPFEEITKEKYDELISKVKKLDLSLLKEEIDTTSHIETVACGGGACEIR